MSDERISGVEAKRLREAATSVAAHPYYGCDRYNNGEACPACERLAEGIEALHQSAPTLCATVEALDQERDEARAGEARVVRAIMGGQAGDRLSAVCRAEALRNALDALRVASAALEWGSREMRGRPPGHWTDALDTVRHALSHSALASPEAAALRAGEPKP
jgi:hypothetical protein